MICNYLVSAVTMPPWWRWKKDTNWLVWFFMVFVWACVGDWSLWYISISEFHQILREGFQKQKWKFEMAFAIRRRTPLPPSKWHKFPSIFLSHFFLLQLNPTYMKRILHLISVKNITFKSSYNWFKIDIHQQLRPLTANYLAMFKVISTTIYT